jgi:hypothetical protein
MYLRNEIRLAWEGSHPELRGTTRSDDRDQSKAGNRRDSQVLKFLKMLHVNTCDENSYSLEGLVQFETSVPYDVTPHTT